MIVLGIESSCDETGLAVYDSEKGLLSHVLHTQIALHAFYGGVVPELASRDHVKYLVRLLDKVLLDAHLDLSSVDAIAYTAGPGLIGALLAGASFAKSLAFSLAIPAIAVHHLEAHLLAAQLTFSGLFFPFLVLLVSGGHTQLIEARALGDYRLLGETLDDAVGEAFDKTAKLIGLPYPGGALLAKLADEASTVAASLLPPFPRPMLDRPGLDFSFSGLKTHAMLTWQACDKTDVARSAIAYAFQEAIVSTLFEKVRRALLQTGASQLVVAGGVGANRSLRRAFEALPGQVYFPAIQFCTDNGAMIAYAGTLHLLKGKQDDTLAINVKARWPFGVTF